MTTSDIIRLRLANQQIVQTSFTESQQVVQWLGAMQAQEYAMAKWAIGLRLNNCTDSEVEKDFAEGEILRTHILRPTWHFVAPSDIRWMLQLSAPRVHAANGSMYRQLELDKTLLKQTGRALTKMLHGEKHLTRAEIKTGLERRKITADGMRLAYIVMHAELEGLICSGPRKGKQFTYALLDERVPSTNTWNREEALAMLTLRYFTSRGPATLQDFVWWSGLTVKEARTGIASLPSSFVREQWNEKEYIFLPTETEKHNKPQTTFLMPDYDEYGISYKNREALFEARLRSGHASPYSHLLVVDGQAHGAWQQTVREKTVSVETTLFAPLNKTQQSAVQRAVKRYLDFLNAQPE